MSAELRTGRGPYRLLEAQAPALDQEWLVLTLALERADGVERVGFRCRIARALIDFPSEALERVIERLGPWIEREFETTREAALKSIRAERRLFELTFDTNNPGPFRPQA